ncbi:MAG: hypothetical protein GKR95_20920 [Gammaproteobacteria bacterium]|nr:hypothetical protein [Gammaproteobacteria bacterium]
MLFILLYSICLVVPGWALLSSLRITGFTNWYLYPISSLGVFVVMSVVFSLFNFPVSWFAVSYFLVVLGLIAMAVKTRYPSLPKFSDWETVSISGNWPIILPAGLFSVLLFYGISVGPYMEIPGDPLWHILKIGEAIEHWVAGEVWEFKAKKDVLLAPNYHWYHFCGWLIELTGANLQRAMASIWIVNFILFTSAFYAFAIRVFKDTELSDLQQKCASALAVVFLLLHFGIGSFSYLRYYAFAPSFIALIGYWSMVIVIWDFLSGRSGLVKAVLLGGFLAFTTMLLHHQEVLFMAVMAVLITGAMFWRWLCAGGSFPWKSRWKDPGLRLKKNRSAQIVCLCFLLVIIGYLVIHGYLYFSRVRNHALEGGWLMPVSHTIPLLKHLFILKPNWQFYQVLTVWGIWGYAVYFFHMRKVKFPVVVVAGIWAPLWTVFNPVFIDFFLRLSFPEVVWRLVYIVPMELALSLLVVLWFQDFSWKTGRAFSYRTVGSLTLILITILLLWPFTTSILSNQYAKFGMLSSVNKEADHRHLNDLVTYLEQISETQLLTDQITGYVINAFTQHRYNGHKFYGHGALNTRDAEYKIEDFNSYQQGILVINQRQGSMSDTGRVSGHWPVNIRLYSKWYSQEFLQFISDNPNHFKLLETLPEISIYRISP